MSEFAIPGRLSDSASSRVPQLPSLTTEEISPRPDRRSARAALVALEVHALNAEIAYELDKQPEAISHFTRAKELLTQVAELFRETVTPSAKKYITKLQDIVTRLRAYPSGKTKTMSALIEGIEKLISSVKLI